MARNAVTEYIELNKREIRSYMRLIFSNKFNNEISQKFEETYINVRYYNYCEENEDISFKKRLLNEIKITKNKLIEEIPEHREFIENMGLFYGYMLYFDTISYCKDISVRVEKLNKLRKKVLNKESEQFEQKFYELYSMYNYKKDELQQKYLTKDFSLKTKSYEGYSNICKIKVKNNLKMPKLYSQYAIDRVFNTGITKEDKLIVEYYLTSLVVIKDIAKGNFNKHYIVEFAATLLQKNKKIRSILVPLENPAIQDKVSLQITYSEFEENKEAVYELINEGFKFSIILDDTFAVNFADLQKLNIFRFIIISKELRKYDEIMDNKVVLSNVVEI